MPVLAALAAAMALMTALPAGAKDQILTAATVEKFVESYPEVRTIAASEAGQKGAEIASASNQLGAVLKAASDDAVAAKVDAAVQDHGFSDIQQWLAVGESVARAYVHVKAGPSKQKAGKKVEKAIKKVENTDFLNDKQKAKLIKALREGASDLAVTPPSENIAAVKPMMSEIEQVMQ